MNLKQIATLARTALQKAGFDLIRYRSLNTILDHHGINVVLDVGANAGQYGRNLRRIGYRGKIVSFEPQQRPFAALAASAARDGHWTAVNIGLGNEDGAKSINVYADSCLSSMLGIQQDTNLFQDQLVGTEEIQIRKLDGILGQYVASADKVLLKIDKQGFEKEVLAGAEQCLPHLEGIQMELSLTPIYAGQPNLDEMIALLRGKGFMLWQIQRGVCVIETGQELEADGIFIRRKEPKG